MKKGETDLWDWVQSPFTWFKNAFYLLVFFILLVVMLKVKKISQPAIGAYSKIVMLAQVMEKGLTLGTHKTPGII